MWARPTWKRSRRATPSVRSCPSHPCATRSADRTLVAAWGSTDAAGQATISWTGTNAGNDQLTAFYDADSSGTFTAGDPNDVAFVNFNRGTLFISTQNSDNIGATHSATFFLEDGAGNPRQDVTIHYSINNGLDQTTATDSNGQATIQWTRATAGTDELNAWYDFDGNATQEGTDPSDTAFVTFSLGSIFISGSGTGSTGQPYTATAFVEDGAGNPVNGGKVRYTISGANPSSGLVTTNSNGNAPIVWTGSNGGTDTLTAYYDENSNGIQDTDEPDYQHSVNWITSITSGGPITAINLGADMACQARYQGDSSGEFYGAHQVAAACTWPWTARSGGRRHRTTSR